MTGRGQDTARPGTLPAPQDEPGPGARHPVVTLLVAVVCQLLVTLAFASINISLTGIRTQLGLSVTELSWVPNAFLLSIGGVLLIGGRLADIAGRRRTLLVGIGLFTIASLAAATSKSYAWLIVGIVGMGIGGGMAEPASLSLVATTFPEGAQRNRALGVFSTATGLGLAGGLIVGGLLSSASWRMALLINVPIGVLILVVGVLLVSETVRTRGRFDLAGALTLALGLAALVYGLVRAGSNGWGDRGTLASLCGAAVLIAVALVAETRASRPVMPLALFADRDRSAAYLSTLLVATLMATLLFCVTQFLEVVLGYDPLEAGLALLPLSFPLFATSTAAPVLLRRFSAKLVLNTGFVLITAGCLWLTQLSGGSGYTNGVLGPLLLVGIGEGLSLTTLNVIILSRLRAGDTGAASGIQQTMGRVGGSLGLAATVTAFSLAHAPAAPHLSPAARLHALLAHQISTAFSLGVAFLVAALATSLFLLRGSRGGDRVLAGERAGDPVSPLPSEPVG